MNASEDDAPFLRILESMGIDKYDPLVPTALNEYATRLASELLKDARDYAAHAGRSVGDSGIHMLFYFAIQNLSLLFIVSSIAYLNFP